MASEFDVTEVVRNFLKTRTPKDRERFRIFKQEVVHNSTVKHLLTEVGTEAMRNECTPVMCIQLGLIYGMTLGVKLAEEKVERGRRAN